jgi:hypothetical protein
VLVDAHAQCRRRMRQFDGLFRGRGARHQRSAGQPPRPMQFDNGAVDPGGQPKIIGIENQTAHRLSVSTQSEPLPGEDRPLTSQGKPLTADELFVSPGMHPRCYDDR